MNLLAEQKPRMRVVRMGVYWGEWFQFEAPTRFELRPGPASPFTLDQTFIGLSPEGVYKAWSEQVEYWQRKMGAPTVQAD